MYNAGMNNFGPYMPPVLVVDSVIFRLVDNQLEVLLIQRTQDPYANHLALPGGYCAAGETTTEAMSRVLEAKGGVYTRNLKLVEQLYTFDTVARDPRGHAVSVTYMGLGTELEAGTSETTQRPAFYRISELPELAYDHSDIVRLALERLRTKLSYTNAIFALLPLQFTLTNLQSAYEAVLGRPLDKRNFRKKFLSLDMIEPTDEMLQSGPHRPARLYKFRTQTLQTLDRNFD